MMRQCNTVDMTRRSPSYEVRLAKYSTRGFEIYVPTLRRADVDPTVRLPSLLLRYIILITDIDLRAVDRSYSWIGPSSCSWEAY